MEMGDAELGSQHGLGAHLGKRHSALRSLSQKQWEVIKDFFIRKCKADVSSISLLLPRGRRILEGHVRCAVVSEAIADIMLGVCSVLASVIKGCKELLRRPRCQGIGVD